MSHTNNDPPSVESLLKKTEHYDKDERYMALADLCDLLQKRDASSPPLAEASLCTTAILRLLHDNSHDVQAVAVKTLSVLLVSVSNEHVTRIAEELTTHVLNKEGGAELRDVYAIGLRTLVRTVVSDSNRIAETLTGRLLEGLHKETPALLQANDVSSTSTNNDSTVLVLCCWEILTDVLQRFPVTRQHEPLLQQCLSHIRQAPTAVRQRAGTCLARLAVVVNDTSLQRLSDALLGPLQPKDVSITDARALIRTLCTIAGVVGQRLGPTAIDAMVPVLAKWVDPKDAVTGDDEEDVPEQDEALMELRESCFVGWEALVAKCPREMGQHLHVVVPAALAYMCYDPNYAYGTEDDATMEEDNDYDDEYEDEEGEDDYDDDDDDDSWKVRRSAIRTLHAVVRAHDQPSLVWTQEFALRNGTSSTLAMAVLQRFKEREENCRVEVVSCFAQLVQVLMAAVESGALRLNDDSMSDAPVVPQFVPQIVKACDNILAVKKANERSKSSTLTLLSTLCHTPTGLGTPEAVQTVLNRLIDGFLKTDTSKTLRLEALHTVHTILSAEAHTPSLLQPSLPALVPQLCVTVQEQWYKVIAASLRALADIPRLYADKNDDTMTTQLYTAIEPLLAAHDVDQEIKECALDAAGALLSSSSNLTLAHRERLLALLLERIQNETTRIAAFKTLSAIASSSSHTSLSLDSIRDEAVTCMASVLQHQSRSLRQAALETLIVVVAGQEGKDGKEELYKMVLQSLPPLLVATDMHLAHLSL